MWLRIPTPFLCRTLYGSDGRFIVDNINEWQHSAMYAAFMLSGIVDLVVFYTPQGTLPLGTEQVCVPLGKQPRCD